MMALAPQMPLLAATPLNIFAGVFARALRNRKQNIPKLVITTMALPNVNRDIVEPFLSGY